QVPSRVDWISFDCYGPWNSCGLERSSVPNLFQKLKSNLGPNQRAVLIPQGTLGSGLNDAQVSSLADQYFQLAQAEPIGVGVIPFQWYSERYATYDGSPPGPFGTEAASGGLGTRDLPTIRAEFTQIGKAIVGNVPPPPPPNQPPPVTSNAAAQCKIIDFDG